MTRVKICGITNKADAFLATELGAHALGFVFAESPRKISPDAAARIIDALPPFITTVGVFVNHPAEDVREIAEYCGLHAVQLHGDETLAYCREFRQKVIKAFRLRNYTEIEEWFSQENGHDVAATPDADNTVAAYLVDAYSRDQYGGTGISLRWELVRNLNLNRPLILAGGLNHLNIADAIRMVKPYAVDVSSGVELKPGKKDEHKMREFMRAVGDVDLKYG